MRAAGTTHHCRSMAGLSAAANLPFRWMVRNIACDPHVVTARLTQRRQWFCTGRTRDCPHARQHTRSVVGAGDPAAEPLRQPRARRRPRRRQRPSRAQPRRLPAFPLRLLPAEARRSQLTCIQMLQRCRTTGMRVQLKGDCPLVSPAAAEEAEIKVRPSTGRGLTCRCSVRR